MQTEVELETDAALDALEALFANARPIPLTDQVRVELRQLQTAAAELREALASERRASC